MKSKPYKHFPQFEDLVLKHTSSRARHIRDQPAWLARGAEILANRLGVGPMFACTECKFEEFFLSSWTAGDPAQIVDVPANTRRNWKTDSGLEKPIWCCIRMILPTCITVTLRPCEDEVARWTKGTSRTPPDAHQWLQTPDDDNSTYPRQPESWTRICFHN